MKLEQAKSIAEEVMSGARDAKNLAVAILIFNRAAGEEQKHLNVQGMIAV